ncbi:MAG: ribosome silencing factor [Gammaproteobacteria bacterium]|nr:ribosome silencing factor [Gammaproteobacteria bacterium]
MSPEQLKSISISALEDLKGLSIQVFDVRDISSVTDFMIIASGNSNRQVKALANSVVVKSKENGCTPIGVEGQQPGNWILVDLADVVVHIMTPDMREFYQLEKLWNIDTEAAS